MKKKKAITLFFECPEGADGPGPVGDGPTWTATCEDAMTPTLGLWGKINSVERKGDKMEIQIGGLLAVVDYDEDNFLKLKQMQQEGKEIEVEIV